MKYLASAIGVFLSVTSLFLVASQAASADEEARRQEIWDRADDDLLRYMKESVTVIADGHKTAYDAYSSWYINVHIPAQDNKPAIEVMLTYVFKKFVSLGAQSIIPFKGVFAVDLLADFANDAYKEVSVALQPVHSREGVKAAMDLQFDLFKQGIVDLPAQFEISQPSQFEDAMFVYLEEELRAPGIHENSDFRLGEETKTFLVRLGFPEPSRKTTERVAEAVLVPMVHETFVRTYGGKQLFQDEDQIRIGAQVQARKILNPTNPRYYCEDAWQLGMLRGEECWQYR